MKTALDYARELVAFNSVSPLSNVEVTNCVEEWLRKLGCSIERVDYDDKNGVRKANVIGKLGEGTGGVAYFGHTDVVPAEDWVFDDHGPFDPTVRDGRLYGRGSTDMKGSVACMLAAVTALASRTPREPVYVVCTADEEVGMVGAENVAARSELYREMVEHKSRCIIGEPTLLEVVYGHKGGTVITVTSRGRAAHSSTNKGINANWKMIPFLVEMKELYEELESQPQWQNPEFNPPTTTLNLGINDHTHAINITPPQSVCGVYFRAMPNIDADAIVERICGAAERHGLEFEIRFRAQPFYVSPDSPYIQECLEFSPSGNPRTVSYGTDAARYGDLERCVVMGPGDIAQAHTHDEWIALEQLEQGTDTYAKMLERWCF
jgi:acetylornithine deacetylase